MADADLDRIPAHRLNRGVLAYLGRNGRLPAVSAPEGHPDPYLRAGSHPEVVDRIWDELGAAAPATRRCLLHGTPALVLRESGVVVAVALGTSYALRLAPPSLRSAVRSGAKTVHEFTTVSSVLDLGATFGDDWVFGSWHADEVDWLRSSLALFAAGG